jgi:DNA polymerase (family 10)
MTFRNPIIPVLLAERDFTDIHSHTTLTDGSASISQMCESARNNGLKYFVISEHVREVLSYDYGAFVSMVKNESVQGLVAIPGSEAKVLNSTGNMDIDSLTLKASRLRIASFHDRPHNKIDYLTTIRKMLNNQTADVWGHPFALEAEFTDTEWLGLCVLAKDNGIVIEVSNRYPMTKQAFNILLETECPYLLASDAHSPSAIRKANDKPVFRDITNV